MYAGHAYNQASHALMQDTALMSSQALLDLTYDSR